ncbi:hypothetical protein [Crocosphaera sp.]|uniref:hypothetical protein n=1 Tax=Crocosphaera sp. TaxID=2729996 RepID=UPI003F2949F7|nr:hypothetical protein [Crocosphaera sp.]
MIITFRNWLEKRAGGGVSWDNSCDLEIPPVERDKAKLFDVYSTHTKDCKVCQDALKNINRLTTFSFITSGICLFFALFIDSRNVAQQQLSTGISLFSVAPPLSFWLLVIGAIALGLVGYYLKKFSKLFYVYHFEHYHND